MITTTGREAQLERVLDGATLTATHRLVRCMPIGDRLIELISRLARGAAGNRHRAKP